MYPSKNEVEVASRIQLARWYRFLKSPGHSTIGHDRESFEHTIRKEEEIMDRIIERFIDMGGFTPAISKMIGWEV